MLSIFREKHTICCSIGWRPNTLPVRQRWDHLSHIWLFCLDVQSSWVKSKMLAKVRKSDSASATIQRLLAWWMTSAHRLDIWYPLWPAASSVMLRGVSGVEVASGQKCHRAHHDLKHPVLKRNSVKWHKPEDANKMLYKYQLRFFFY